MAALDRIGAPVTPDDENKSSSELFYVNEEEFSSNMRIKVETSESPVLSFLKPTVEKVQNEGEPLIEEIHTSRNRLQYYEDQKY